MRTSLDLNDSGGLERKVRTGCSESLFEQGPKEPKGPMVTVKLLSTKSCFSFVLNTTLNCFHVRTLFLVFQQSQCDAGLGLPFKPNEVVLSAGGHGNVLVSPMAHPKSVEPMVQQSLLANFAASLFLVPRDMRQRVAEFMNRSFHPNEEFVRRKASGEHIMADSRVSFVPLGVEGAVRSTSPRQCKWDWCQSTCTTCMT